MSRRTKPYWLIPLGALLVLIALAVVPISPAMVQPLYWRLASFLAEEPLADRERKDVSDRVCPMLTEQSVASVVDRRNGVWAFQAPKSLLMQCADHRVRYLVLQFDEQTGQCTAEAVDSPTCDL